MFVELIQAKSYDLADLQPKIDRLLAPLADRLQPGLTVVVKPNLLMKASPDQAITTHPSIVEAVCHHLIARGLEVTIADSPGGPMIQSSLDAIYQASGLTAVAERTGASLNHDLRTQLIKLPTTAKLHQFEVLSIIQEADFIINLPKCKTHGIMTFTGATKNLYGVIPGLTKAQHHLKLTKRLEFAEHLVDLAEFVQADFHLMDGIVGHQGDGPSGGFPADSGFLASSTSCHALDYIVSQVIGIDDNLIPTLQVARQRGLIPDDLEVRGDTIVTKAYQLPLSTPLTFLPNWLPVGFQTRVAELIRPKPDFRHARCIGCGKCAQICPPQVITMNLRHKPVCNFDDCISCFCCHEICPVKAIEIRQSIWGKLLKKS